MRRWLLLFGVLVSLVGVVGVAVPSVFARFQWPTELLLAVGVVALFSAVSVAYNRRSHSVARPSVPAVERRSVATLPEPATPTSILDHPALSYRARRRAQREQREAIRELAVDVLVRYDGDTPARARERLETGTWTADPQAQAFFSSSGGVPSWSEILALQDPGRLYRQRLHSAIEALFQRIQRGDRQ